MAAECAPLPQGEGTCEQNGNHFSGNFMEGLMNGFGACKYTDGSSYEGDWVDGLWHGSGGSHFEGKQRVSREWHYETILSQCSRLRAHARLLPTCQLFNCASARNVVQTRCYRWAHLCRRWLLPWDV
jgi:hypothetical protein